MNVQGSIPAHHEIELKLEADPDVIRRLRRARPVTALAEGPSHTATLESVYFDSADLSLARKGIALRIRKTAQGFEQTVKRAAEGDGPITDRFEWTAILPEPLPNPALIPDEAAARRVQKLMAKGALVPVYKTVVRRTARMLKLPDGALIEIAFDSGVIAAPDANPGLGTPVSEIELELKSGAPESLIVFARDLARLYPLRLSGRSKSERGLDLLAKAPHRPRKAKEIAFGPNTSAEEGFIHMMTHCLRHALDNEDAVLHGHDPEGVHQMRVALRRMRSALTAFGKSLRTMEMERLRGETKWLADTLGAARDLDVFVDETLEPLAALRPDDGALKDFMALARAAREGAWRELLHALGSSRYRLLMIELSYAISARIWRRDADLDQVIALNSPLRELAGRALDKRFDVAADLGRRIADLDTEQRHELRLALKKLRYAGEFFESLFAEKKAQPFLKRVAAMQEVFGCLNDMAVASALIERLRHQAMAADPASAGDLQWACGLITGWHTARLAQEWPKAQKLWKDLESTGRFWGSDG